MIASSMPPRSLRLSALLLVGALAASGCGSEASPRGAKGGIDRETFIAAYVDLRAVTIRGDSAAISDALRAEVLARHGITEQDLLDFAERHGEDVPFMRSVWDEVEARLDRERVLAADRGAPDPDPAPSRNARPR